MTINNYKEKRNNRLNKIGKDQEKKLLKKVEDRKLRESMVGKSRPK